MDFKKLREATLTKTQIKKVHDKADDLPKNDFIKRYGKDGDSVRFATATKMVKKELGIEDYEEGFKSDAQRRAAFASGYKEKGKKKKEEVEEATKGNDFVGVSKSAQEYKQGAKAAKDGVKYDDNPYKSGTREMNIKRLNWSAGHNAAREEVEITENISGEKVAQGYAKTIAKMTDGNDHFGARKYIADLIKDKELSQMYDSLEKAHRLTNGAGNHAIGLRGKMESILKYRVGKKLRPDIARIILGGL